MHKTEIGWTRQDELGEKTDVFARRVGPEWQFFARQRRYDQWARIPQPSLEDWRELLDGVRRRAGRQLMRPEEPGRVEMMIRQQYPDAEL